VALSTSRILVLATAVLASSGCGSGGATKAGQATQPPPVVLTLASAISGGQPIILEEFASEVLARTHGSVRIEFKPNWRAGDVRQEQRTIRDVRIGQVDLAWVGARAWDAVGIHDFDALIAPFLVDSYSLEGAVFRAGIPQEMLEGVRRAGVFPIGVLPGPLRLLLSVRQPTLHPSQLRGEVVGVIGRLAADTFRTLGATPRAVYAQTPLDGLDAAEMQASSVKNMLYDDTARYLVANASFWPRPLVLIAAPRVVRALGPERTAVLVAAARAAERDGVAVAREEETGAAGDLCRRHRMKLLALTPMELRAFRLAVQPVYTRLGSDARTRAFLRRITLLAKGRSPQAAFRCGTQRPASYGHAVTVLDGTWKMSASQDYLIRHHPRYLPPPTHEALLLDSGWYRLRLDHGRFEAWHGAPLIYKDSTGFFGLRGNTIVLTYTGGSDAGGTWRYRWSLYRGALTLRPVGRTPAELGVAAWRRVHR